MDNAKRGDLKKLFYFLEPLWKDKAKWVGFGNFLESPIHVNSRRKPELLGMIGELFKGSAERTEEALFNIVFPEKDYKLNKSHLRTRLSSVLEHYFEYEALLGYQKDSMMEARYIMQRATESQWDRYFDWIYEKKALKALNALPLTESYYIHQLDLSDHCHRYNNRQERNREKFQARFEEELNAVNQLHAIQLLKLVCKLINENQVHGVSTELRIPRWDDLLKEIEMHWSEQPPFVQAYYLVYRGMVLPDDNEYYFRLKSILMRDGLSFGRSEARKLFQHANNYCVRKSKPSLAEKLSEEAVIFRKELEDLYDFQLREGLIFRELKEERYLDHRDFKNLVVFFCKLGKLEWVEGFIQQYSEKVLKHIRSEVAVFARGILKFYREDWEEAGSLIQTAVQGFWGGKEPLFGVSARGYQLRILFEKAWNQDGDQGEKNEDCIREADNIIRSIRFNRFLSADDKQRNQQFCKYVKRLCKAYTFPLREEKKQACDRLKEELENDPVVTGKDWLKSKMTLKEG